MKGSWLLGRPTSTFHQPQCFMKRRKEEIGFKELQLHLRFQFILLLYLFFNEPSGFPTPLSDPPPPQRHPVWVSAGRRLATAGQIGNARGGWRRDGEREEAQKGEESYLSQTDAHKWREAAAAPSGPDGGSQEE